MDGGRGGAVGSEDIDRQGRARGGSLLLDKWLAF